MHVIDAFNDRYWPKAVVRTAGDLAERRAAVLQKRPYTFWLRKIQFEFPLRRQADFGGFEDSNERPLIANNPKII